MNFLEELLRRRMAESQAVSTGFMQPEMSAHSSIDNIIGQNQLTMSQMPEPTVVGGEGLGNLVEMMSPMKAVSMIPAGTDRMKIVLDLFKQYRGGLNTKKQFAKDMVEGMKNQGVKESDMISGNVLKGQKKQLENVAKESAVAQVLNQAMNQYNMYGTARPGTEKFIQSLLEQIYK